MVLKAFEVVLNLLENGLSLALHLVKGSYPKDDLEQCCPRKPLRLPDARAPSFRCSAHGSGVW